MARRLFQTQWKQSASLVKGIEDALAHSEAVYFPTVLARVFAAPNKPIDVEAGFIQTIQSESLCRIGDIAETGKLLRHTHFTDMFYFWKEREPEKVLAWAKGIQEKPEDAVYLLSQFLASTTSSKGTEKYVHKDALSLLGTDQLALKGLFKDIAASKLCPDELVAYQAIMNGDILSRGSQIE